MEQVGFNKDMSKRRFGLPLNSDCGVRFRQNGISPCLAGRRPGSANITRTFSAEPFENDTSEDTPVERRIQHFGRSWGDSCGGNQLLVREQRVAQALRT